MDSSCDSDNSLERVDSPTERRTPSTSFNDYSSPISPSGTPPPLPSPPPTPPLTTTTTTSGAFSYTTSSITDTKQQLIHKFQAQMRRPGLGVGMPIPSKPFPTTLTPEEARKKLGCEIDGDFSCFKTMSSGDLVYMVDFSFFSLLQQWLSGKVDQLPPHLQLSNLDLFEFYETIDRPGRMRVDLKENVDYVLVSERVWEVLMMWVGGGPSVMRKCCNDKGRICIDVRGLELKLKRSSRPTKFVRNVFSKYDTVGQLKRVACEDWSSEYNGKKDADHYRVWDYYDEKCRQRMHPNSAQLCSFNLVDSQSIMFEEAAADGDFAWDPETGEPPLSEPTTYSGSSHSGYWNSSSMMVRRQAENMVTSSRAPVSQGVVGLTNLGNTCFMNSTLQCLNHLWPLRVHFTSDAFLQEINAKNPLGTGGKLAKSFGDLMKLMWSNQGDVISPAGFKSQMAEFKPEFSGYQQHDSQELLSFLLDGLHEDLNRVKVKPSTVSPEANGRSDAEFAAECKAVHRLRNDSKVSDLFEGFYRSTVICPDCGKHSVTFDPFSVVQLPLSKRNAAKLVSISLTVLDSESGLPLENSPVQLRVPVNTYVYDVRNMANLGTSDFFIASIRNKRVDKLLPDWEHLERLSSGDEFICFQSEFAPQWRHKELVSLMGLWHRPLEVFSAEVGSCASSSSSPFAKGDVFVGSVDHQKVRMRMQVTEDVQFGLWGKGLGYLVQAMVDISPVVSGYADKLEGVEENAYLVEGFVSQQQRQTEGSFTCEFSMVKFMGSFGSFMGRYPRLDSSISYEFEGTIVHGEFLSGTMSEKTASSSSIYKRYSASQVFSMVKVRNELVPTLDQVAFVPVGPSLVETRLTIVGYNRMSYDTVGQPFVVSLPSWSSPRDLYMALVDRFTKRIRARNALLRIAESDSTKDPFGLLPLMHLVIPSQGLVSLQSEDTDVCLSALSSHEGLTITLEWKAMDTKSPLFQTLFESLYGEEGSAPLPPPKANSLYNCFSLFTEQEKLAPTEMWYCSNCKDHKEAFKEMQFWDFPDLLVIQLKRFSQSQNSYSFDKDDSEVDFPLEALDLRDRVQHESDGSEVYDLVAVSHHFGGLGMGHYIAHARDERDGMWYELDDSSVRPLGNNQSAAEKVKQGSAYVLFYVKQKLVPASWNNAGSLSSLASSAAL